MCTGRIINGRCIGILTPASGLLRSDEMFRPRPKGTTMRGIVGMKGLTKGRTVAMETIQDRLREEARDYQDLAAMAFW